MKQGSAARIAYVDTSFLVSITLGERGSAALERRLGTFDELAASNLLEAELRAALVREHVVPDPDFLAGISWILPDRPLVAEIGRVLAAADYLRGADCWHLAAALYLVDDPGEITFLTLDNKQGEIARMLGFNI